MTSVKGLAFISRSSGALAPPVSAEFVNGGERSGLLKSVRQLGYPTGQTWHGVLHQQVVSNSAPQEGPKPPNLFRKTFTH